MTVRRPTGRAVLVATALALLLAALVLLAPDTEPVPAITLDDIRRGL